jgi:hypothetical protein
VVHCGAAQWRAVDDDVLVEVEVGAADTETRTMWFRVPAGLHPSDEAMADALFPIGLLLAMSTDGILELDQPVSAPLLENADIVQDILLSWHGHKLSRARIEVAARPSGAVERAPGVAACFTGGVDSFYTLVKNSERITHLVYVHGFDIPLARTDLYAAVAPHLREVAAEVGVELIEMSSNLKSFFPHLSWATMTHGPALASIGMLLTGRCSTLLIPASHTYSQLYRWGSHPLLDSRFSTETVRIEHDGAEASRVDKTVTLAHSPVAQRHLRVCWQNTGSYNCGVCGKCLRTKTCLRLAGALESFRTFDHVVDPAVLRATPIANASDLSFVTENRDYARQVGDVEIARALSAAIRSYRVSSDPVRRRLKAKLDDSRRAHADSRRALVRTRRELRRAREEQARLREVIVALRSRRAVRWSDAISRMRATVRRRGRR